MDKLSWLDHPAVKNIDVKKLAILTEFINESEGKSIEKAIPLLMNTNKKLKQQNLAFTKDENDLITEILTKNMTPQEKRKLEMVKNMLNKKKK